MASRQSSYMKPGPKDTSLLKLQSHHISEAIWRGRENRILYVRSVGRIPAPDHRIEPYLRDAGFYGISQIRHMKVDWHLISALVERWRPETHTFHTTQGEMTITLQDVAILFGLPVDGKAVTGSTNLNWRELCQRLLGSCPQEGKHFKGQRISVKWLADNYSTIPDNADDRTIRYYTRAYILRLLGGVLFPDKSSTFVYLMFLPLLEDFAEAGKYSWGSACLAWCYRELCKATDYRQLDISGCMLLVQLWAWGRFPSLAPMRRGILVMEDDRGDHLPLGYQWRDSRNSTDHPTHMVSYYRQTLDRLPANEVIWQPYTAEIMANLPPYCLAGKDIWRAQVPLICFHIIEWHSTVRVLRQFGLQQPIPGGSDVVDALHDYTLQGKQDQNWPVFHAYWISLWDHRHERVYAGEPGPEHLSCQSAYMQWYTQITRRWISPTGALLNVLADMAEDIYKLSSTKDDNVLVTKIRSISLEMLTALDEHKRLESLHVSESSTPLAVDIPRPSYDVPPLQRQKPRRQPGLAGKRKRQDFDDDSGSTNTQTTRIIVGPSQPELTRSVMLVLGKQSRMYT